MKTKWDYTELAVSYLKRPDYSEPAIDEMLETSNINGESIVCDIGAGIGHLTIMLANRELTVDAVEPNDAMRQLGMKRTKNLKGLSWYEAVAEDTGLSGNVYDLVTFGSSFNVTDRQKALQESHRLLKPSGWFACMWNHRDLDDPIQSAIERAISEEIPDYDYGVRRADQTDIIDACELFEAVRRLEGEILHTISIVDCVEAWRSHATLQRQAGKKFPGIIKKIDKLLKSFGETEIKVPYMTRIWMAQKPS